MAKAPTQEEVKALVQKALKWAHMNRLLAKGIDFAVFIFFAKVFPLVLGPLVGFAYSVLCDGMNFGPFRSQSIGKKIFDLQAVSLVRGGAPADYKDSAIRNAPVGLVTFFAIIPIWGWFIMAFLGIPLLILELYFIEKMENGHRLGDVMADTEVRPFKP